MFQPDSDQDPEKGKFAGMRTAGPLCVGLIRPPVQKRTPSVSFRFRKRPTLVIAQNLFSPCIRKSPRMRTRKWPNAGRRMPTVSLSSCVRGPLSCHRVVIEKYIDRLILCCSRCTHRPICPRSQTQPTGCLHVLSRTHLPAPRRPQRDSSVHLFCC
jgi:hypothetical protein